MHRDTMHWLWPVTTVACFALILGTGTAAGQDDWFEDFEDYDAGVGLVEQSAPGWEGWDGDITYDADVADELSFSPDNSLRMRSTSDTVAVYRGYTEGLWTFRAQTYIPAGHTGGSFFILLNQYNTAGGAKNWSTQIGFSGGGVTSSGGSGFGGSGFLPWVEEEWVELRIDIDLDNNLQVITYNGEFLDETPWQMGGIDEIQALDLWSDAGSEFYVDDLSLTLVEDDQRPRRTVSITGDCPDPDPVAVTIRQVVPDGTDPADTVTVTEVVQGAFGAADVTVGNGGTAVDYVPTGVIPRSTASFVTAWLALGPYQLTSGAAANLPVDVMMLDYLTDGEDIFQEDVEPVAGDTVNTLYDPIDGAASLGLAPTSNPAINPGGVPTWFPFVDNNDTFNFNDDAYYNQDINHVVVYALSYVTFENELDVSLCVGSDDGVEVLFDEASVHVNSVDRGYGGAGECQDLVALGTVSAGQHKVMVKSFENGGGHGFRLGFVDNATGGPAAGISACLVPEADPCEFDAAGATITWEGVTREQLAGDGVGYTVDVDKGSVSFLGDVDGAHTWAADGSEPVDLCPDPTNGLNGHIKEFMWAGIGPFTHTYGCSGQSPDLLLGNHIANADIRCEYPSLDEEIDYDPAVAVSTSYTGPTGDDGFPVWRVVSDGNDDGAIDLNVAIGNEDDVMAWLVTYVENVSGDDLDVTICLGSDDSGQIWVDNELVHNNYVCRGRTDCADRIPYIMSPGVHAIKMGVWDRGTGWGASLGLLRAADDTPIHAGAEIDFLGPNLPEGVELPCPDICETVADLACEKNDEGGIDVSWTNSEKCGEIEISVNQVPVETLPADATEVTIEADDLPDEDPLVICIENGALSPACCTISANVALGKIADQSTTNGAYIPARGVDGDLANFTHTAAGNNGLGPAIWEVDLGAPTAIDRIVVHNRDDCCGSRLRDIIVSVHDISFREDTALDPTIAESTDVEFPLWEGGAILESDLLNPENELGAFPLGPDMLELDLDGEGVVGQYVRVTRIPDTDLSGSGGQGNNDEATVLSLGEVQVIESSGDVPGGPEFVRGNANADGVLNITDGIFILNYLFLGGPTPPCLDAANANGDGVINITDGIYVLNFLFLGGPEPTAPYPDCGLNAGDGDFGCLDFPSCP